ncbi:MAG: TIGR00341 family protein [Rickettsiales bacterium]|nr:TIGR00341 family protein [Rickettsiales bacterium]
MADRLVEIYAEETRLEELEKIAEKHEVITAWHVQAGESKIHYHMLVDGSRIQELIDMLQDHFDKKDDYHVLIGSVEAYLPKPDLNDDEEAQRESERKKAASNVLREELESELLKNAVFDRNSALLVIFSTMVATVGLLEDNVAVLVGAMVIAPFLGPNLALTFASAMGNLSMAWQAAKTLLIGSAVAYGFTIIAGQFWPFDTIPKELSSRAVVDYSSIFLAMASGAAAVLSLSKGINSVLVGVMVAVALLPPLTASALFLSHGMFEKSAMAALLLAVNIVCINLSGLITFILRGIGPRTWWEKRKAKKSVYFFASGWAGMLFILTIVIGVI